MKMRKGPRTRKQLLREWPKERVDAFLAAESVGAIMEVTGGWMIGGEFMPKFPFNGEMLTSYLEYLAFEWGMRTHDHPEDD